MAETVIQITGQSGSGKSEAAVHLQESFGFTTVLISDLIRDYAKPRNIALRERKDYWDAHTKMLSELGKLSVIEEIMAIPSELIVVDGIRVPAHAQELRKHGPLVALDCPQDIRFERTLMRNGPLDKPTLEAFIDEEEQESQNADPYAHNTEAVMKLADHHIDSSRSLTKVMDDLDIIAGQFISR